MDNKIPCPFCGEQIMSTAKKCRFCGEWLETPQNPQAPQPSITVPESKPEEVPPTKSREKDSAEPTSTRIAVDNMTEVFGKIFPMKNIAWGVIFAIAIVLITELTCLAGEYTMGNSNYDLLGKFILSCLEGGFLFAIYKNLKNYNEDYSILIFPLIALKIIRSIVNLDFVTSTMASGYIALPESIIALILIIKIRKKFDGRLRNIASWGLSVTIINIIAAIIAFTIGILYTANDTMWIPYATHTRAEMIGSGFTTDLVLGILYIIIYLKAGKMFNDATSSN